MNATSPHIIDITHVSKAFGEKKALDDINLYVRKGEFMTILGHPFATSCRLRERHGGRD